MSAVPNVTLNNGVQMPQLGFGVWQVPDEDATAAVRTAIEVGYRSIDTAAIYGNEEGTGKGLAESGVAREELFVTTKLWNGEQGYDTTLAAFEESLRRLKLDYVDLYLIHWPVPSQDKYVDTWKAFEKLYADGRARSIGVSNFNPHHLRRLFADTTVVPALNQIELHPYLIQEELRAFDSEHGIATEAWSPLAQGGELLKDAEINTLAEKYGKTPAQIVLRWHIQLGNVVIPKSVTPSRIAENFDLFDFELSATDLGTITSLNRNERTGGDPDTLGS
ncbi:Aldo/keto reductase [Actinopolymorpha cephalotaxi]|uniref:Aldo/keto reductase n=1 Tax=Actinopolymorpha cephalotaxi TaxID=504797 RepID=A0A1I2M7K1_9ACTN|nr:aldo/keto reductase [Actinopolymorpha cephalotaxi]NYH81599.1 diketogulonate reductase-like aldo/keto reductase [Actinopolymorpha cephalotaxi]SFF86789.1 Aldo/keto reductase [Actinopolymorpha cephalotaxi]